MKSKIHRDYKLNEELHYVILRLVQMRDKYLSSGEGTAINSVKYRGVELDRLNDASFSLCELSSKEAIALCKSIGYVHTKNLPNTALASKNDITVNGKNYSIRCLNFTDKALVNHSTRRKYEAVANKLGIGISTLDFIIDQYWVCRDLEIFNEDCYPYSSLNPFLEHEDYLKQLLTFMAFRTFNFKKAFYEDDFIVEEINNILDYVDPWDDTTWHLYSPTTYFSAIWPCLCFSMRDTKGMPTDENLKKPENEDIRKWVRYRNGRYKGALHIRVKKFDASKYQQDFETQFEHTHKEELQDIKVNQGEFDEYLVKLFLIDCKRKKLTIPIGDTFEVVESVSSSSLEYGYPRIWLNWEKQQPKLVVFICNEINAGKAGSLEKADVFVNHIGISIKSRRGEPPSIINHTARHNILRVMNEIGRPIAPLDSIIDRYWNIRLNGGKEDVCNEDHSNPFYCDENGHSNISILKPLINYFAFNGTGKAKAVAPAKYILSVGIPDNIDTWNYYDESDFVDSVWEELIFSIRKKGLPKNLTPEMLPWIREIDGVKRGSLNIRIGNTK